FGRCAGYPVRPTVADRTAWLRAHALEPAAVYVHTAGRGLEQVKGEARLRDELELLADELDAAGTPVELHGRLRDAVRNRPDLAWALRPDDRSGAPSMLVSILMLVVLGAVALVLLPLLVVVLVVFLLAIRWHE